MCLSSIENLGPVPQRPLINGWCQRKVSCLLQTLLYLTVSFTLGGMPVVNSTETPATKPNIIFVLADDLGWNDVSFHGYNEILTPNIDRMAAEGVILNGYYTQYLCTPSRSALMTGKYPIRTGLQRLVLMPGEARGLHPSEKILPQYLKDAGYKTHMIGKWHLGHYQKEMTPMNRGFDSFFGFHGSMVDYFNYTPTAMMPEEYVTFDLWDNFEPAHSYIGQYATEVFTEKALERINEHDYKDPLFLYVSHAAPHFANFHDPIQAPQKYIDRFPNIVHEGRREYAATVSALDDSVGQILDALEAKGVAGNSIVVFSSDNGGGGAEQSVLFPIPSTFANNWPLRGAKASQWEGAFRVAACIWSDLLEKKGRVSKELYHITDWLPTFVRLAGGSVNSAIDGFDIWDSISKGWPSPRVEILHQIDPVSKEYALRWHQYKLVSGSHETVEGHRIDQWFVPEGGLHQEHITNAPGAIVCEASDMAEIVPCHANVAPCLFDIEKDPCEYKNIANDRKDIVDFLLDKINTFNKTALPSYNFPFDPRAKAVHNNGLAQPWDHLYICEEDFDSLDQGYCTNNEKRNF